MDFLFGAEQNQFRDVVARFCRERCPPSRARRRFGAPDALDRELWEALCAELGLGGLRVPEDFGGAGFGPVETGIAMEELGRVNAAAPLLASSVLSAGALLHAGTAAAQAQWLPPLGTGSQIATLALAEADGRWEPCATTVTAQRQSGGWRLSGAKRYVPEGAAADTVLVAARTPGSQGRQGLSLFAVRAGTPGLSIRALESLDPTRPLAQIGFDNAAAELLSEEGAAAAGLERARDEALAALSCEMLGGAQALLDATVGYARTRVQFGRVIGGFQAVKHRLADWLLEVELARSAAYRASELAATDPAALPAAAAAAKALAADAFLLSAREAVQLHGGIGFTWEHDTHLYFRRARASAALLGGAALHRERYLQIRTAAVAGVAA